MEVASCSHIVGEMRSCGVGGVVGGGVSGGRAGCGRVGG